MEVYNTEKEREREGEAGKSEIRFPTPLLRFTLFSPFISLFFLLSSFFFSTKLLEHVGETRSILVGAQHEQRFYFSLTLIISRYPVIVYLVIDYIVSHPA